MIRPEIVDYVQKETVRGTSGEIIKGTLTQAGWQEADIQDSLNSLTHPSTTASSVPRVTEKELPIESRWILKSIAAMTPFLLFFILILMRNITNVYAFFYTVYYIANIPILILRKRYYTYVLEDQVFELKQGIINKQHRTLPYGVIQNVFVQQGVFDRIFGLANVVIENTAAGAGASAKRSFWTLRASNAKSAPGDVLGFSAGRISIPGLSKENAEKLKTYVLQKMKENPINDKQSGL